MRTLIRLFFRTVRLVVSPFVVTIDRLTQPKGIERPAEAQALIDLQARELALYHFQSCPFCIKTRRFIRRLSLPIELRDAQHDSGHRAELLSGGGEVKVPCLRIPEAGGQVRWLYESTDIIDYLNTRFATE